jgi:Class III cytochrome C family
MKKRLLAVWIPIVSGLIFLTVGVLTAASVPDDVRIENKGYKADKKGPVKLSHKKHTEEYKVACTDCHHEYKDGKNTWKDTDPVKKCSDCHDPEEKKDNVDKLQNAFHKNCQSCHKELKGKEAPYKKCNDCHEKKD